MEVAISDRSSCPTCRAVFRGGFQRCPRDGAVLVPGDGDPLLGTVLADRYVIEALLGEGGIGRVYRARHVRMSRRYAIKVPFGELAYDSKVRDRFHNEAEAASRLQHPNVIGVIDVGESAEGLLYLAMDLAEGENLAQIIFESGPLPRARVLSLLRQIAEGLDHAHQRGLVHRDLKPENIILERLDGGDRARIVDFGIAILRDAHGGGRLTTQGIVLGTPHYMAPEQACDQPIDHRTDLFALGLILYEMLAGVLPFDGSALEVARKNLAATPRPIAERVPGLAVDRLVEATAFWLLEKRPEHRPQSAAALIELVALIETDPDAARVQLRLGEVAEIEGQALAPVVAGRPAPRSPRAPSHLPPGELDDGPYHTDRVTRRRRGLWIGIAIALLGIAALVVQLARSSGPAEPAASPPLADATPLAPIAVDAAVEIEVATPADAAVEVAPDAAVEPGDRHTGNGKRPRPDAGVATVRPPPIDAGVATVRPPPVDAGAPGTAEPPSAKSLTALYNQVGEQLNAFVNDRGSSAATGFKKRYLAIPYMEATRKPDLRAETMQQLRSLASDLAAAR